MKTLTLPVLILVAMSAQAQSVAIENSQDTLTQSDTVRVTPYLSNTPANAIGNFTVVGSDQIAMQMYAGLNIFNTLRGHVPNFQIADSKKRYAKFNADVLIGFKNLKT